MEIAHTQVHLSNEHLFYFACPYIGDFDSAVENLETYAFVVLIVGAFSSWCAFPCQVLIVIPGE